MAQRFGCLVAGLAGAAILVSLSRALEFLFKLKSGQQRGWTCGELQARKSGRCFYGGLSFGRLWKCRCSICRGNVIRSPTFWDGARLGWRGSLVLANFPGKGCRWRLSSCSKQGILVNRWQRFPLIICAKMTPAVACRTRIQIHGELMHTLFFMIIIIPVSKTCYFCRHYQNQDNTLELTFMCC